MSGRGPSYRRGLAGVDLRVKNYNKFSFSNKTDRDSRFKFFMFVSDYKDYTIYVTVYTDDKMKTTLIEADYNLARDRSSATMYEIK